MFNHLGLLPLGQLNSNAGTAPAAVTGGAPAATGMAEVPAPAATVVTTGPGMQGTTTTTSMPSTTQAAPPPGGIFSNLMGFAPIILMFVALYFIMFRGQRKEEKRKKSLLAELKKGDKVMTIGGLVANVVSVEQDEVVLKIDESANVKARYRKSAIQEVLGADDKK